MRGPAEQVIACTLKLLEINLIPDEIRKRKEQHVLVHKTKKFHGALQEEEVRTSRDESQCDTITAVGL